MKDEGGMVKGGGKSAEEAAAVAAVRRLAERARARGGLEGVPLDVHLRFQVALYGGAASWLVRRLSSGDTVEGQTLDECMRRTVEISDVASIMRRQARQHREQADELDRQADEWARRAREAKGEGNE